MTGTKFGCGMALCGACTVHLDGAATRACITPISATVGKKITTIEAIGTDIDVKSAPQRGSTSTIYPPCSDVTLAAAGRDLRALLFAM
jgi:isoquinoline 1-oxidoreductase subunit alpha